MNDPHVEELQYKVVHPDSADFSEAGTLRHETESFQVELRDDDLVLRPKSHYANEADALAAARPFIRAWQIDAGLRLGPNNFILAFKTAKVIDRKPKPGAISARTRFIDVNTHGAKVTLTAKYSEYPAPPERFVASESVEHIYWRYVRYQNQQA